MVIGTSAVMAILLDEPEADSLARAIAKDSRRLMSVFSALEASIVIETKKGEKGGQELDLLLHRAEIDLVSLDERQLSVARAAYRRYGKGRSPAGLNIGDCCAYALARSSGEPLLYAGRDFSQTDIPSVVRLSK